MLSTDAISLQLTARGIDAYCRDLARRTSTLEKRVAALDALTTFISTQADAGAQAKAEFSAIKQTLLDHFEQAREALLAERAQRLQQALLAHHLPQLTTLYTSLSRDAFWTLLGRIEQQLDSDALQLLLSWGMPREPITVPDIIVGNVTRALLDRELQDPDFVIVHSDGNPVFHFVNVVDDLEMKITHVIRGEDHLSNTPKHIALFRAFGVEPPQYAHIPMILNLDGSKMSKRDPVPAKARLASLSSYVEDGFLPEAVRNYLCLLGWSPKDDRQVIPPPMLWRSSTCPACSAATRSSTSPNWNG